MVLSQELVLARGAIIRGNTVTDFPKQKPPTNASSALSVTTHC